jgi:ribosome-associated translation inhibitor RaiA
VEIIFHVHHAAVSDRMRRRAELAAKRAASRLTRVVDAVVRFEQDGPVKRVEIVLHAPRQRDIVASGEARYFGPALRVAVDRLTAQIRKLRETRKSLKRKPPPARAAIA